MSHERVRMSPPQVLSSLPKQPRINKDKEPSKSLQPPPAAAAVSSNGAKGAGNASRDTAIKPPVPKKEKLKAPPVAPGKAQKTKKRASPFRVKVGCVVSLRFRTEGNSISIVSDNEKAPKLLDFDDSLTVWTSPLPGRDSGLALIGKRVRCFLPKMGNDQKRRVLEGEIVSLIDYGLKRKRGRSTRVGLLVDKKRLVHCSDRVKRLDEDVDVSKLPNEKARRNHRLEENIRGKDKAIVDIRLPHPSSIVDVTNSIQWVIQKRVPPKLFYKPTRRNSVSPTPTVASTTAEGAAGETPNGLQSTNNNGSSGAVATGATIVDARPSSDKNGRNGAEPPKKRRKIANPNETKHVGDGNDPQEQQVSNWRWLACRFHDLLLSSRNDSVDPYGEDVLSGGFTGEVLKVETSSESTTLAIVTLRRLFLPEHTAKGRLPHHGLYDIFNDHDATSADGAVGATIRIQVPVEHLIIISSRLEKVRDITPTAADWERQLHAAYAYSLQDDSFVPLVQRNELSLATLPDAEIKKEPCVMTAPCHRCRKAISEAEAVTCASFDCPFAASSGGDGSMSWCSSCLEVLRAVRNMESPVPNGSTVHCYHRLCDCSTCRSLVESQLQQELWTAIASAAAESDTAHIEGFVDTGALPVPSAKPVKRVKARSPKKLKKPLPSKLGRGSTGRTSEKKKANGKLSPLRSDSPEAVPAPPKEDYSVFKPSCARLVPYDATGTGRSSGVEYLSTNTDKPRILREALMDRPGEGEKEDKTSSSRAARANQRRLMKGVAAIGATTLGLDTLANRESQLRFDRSGIHAWGVFADEAISAGEVIVEYRGELIGNAMAEKREKQYEAAKIGSDYMFRIDSLIVCDATKQGNVARFLNASCGPNCYTKIITIDGVKRIVIYAKRDIRTGEELCYDYMFPLEVDEAKRIPCHCGTKECRGFMNWDKRYVAMAASPGETAPPEQEEEPLERPAAQED